MKKYFSLLVLMFVLAGCDSPQRTRSPSNFVTANGFGNTSTGFNPSNPTQPGTIPTNPGSGSGVTTPGFEVCDLSDKYHTIDIGFFGLCQSSQDETLFKFRPSMTSTSVRTCLIPTYKDAQGASTYIGNPQCTYTTSNQVVTGNLYKNRNGFQTYPLNGVIVMKEPLLPEYMACMNGYVAWPQNVCPQGPNTSYCAYWIPRCPAGGRSNAQCDTEAKNYMSNICNSFKSRYSNSYIDIRTR